MEAPYWEAERCVQERDKRRWTPLLMAGSLIGYALTGLMAVAMLLETRPEPIFVCGIGDVGVVSATPVDPLIEPEIETEELHLRLIVNPASSDSETEHNHPKSG